jgi:hypothetical protein
MGTSGAIAAGLFAWGLTASFACSQTLSERAACKSDYYKFCSDVKPGGGRPLACLAQHKDALTSGCRKVVVAHGN